MGNGFATKLAFSNIKMNRKFYIPYVVASVGIIMTFYIMSYLSYNKGLNNLAGSESLKLIMVLGSIVLGIFSLIFIFYINSFLMKRRQKEIGLYNILGMEKRHISKILLLENCMTSIFSIVVGIASGILFSKLIFMILCKTMNLKTPIGFEISLKGLAITAAVFGVIFFLTLLKNQMSVRLAKPIELLRGSEVGEREPKSKLILAVLGVICLGIGYYIAITTDNPLSALLLFFVAVILVIIGTYMLFIAGSIAILKVLRKNKKFYYKANHFTAVSGMLYRMKQNAVGLANICILSTMVLVMISTTVCLRVGIDDLIDNASPGDITFKSSLQEDGINKTDDLYNAVVTSAKENNVSLDKVQSYLNLSVTCEEYGNKYTYTDKSPSKAVQISIITKDDYERLTGNKISLEKNNVIASGSKINDNFQLGDISFTVKSRVDKILPNNDENDGFYKTYYLVVADKTVLNNIGDGLEKQAGFHVNYKYPIIIYSSSTQAKLDKMCLDINSHDFNFLNYHAITTRADMVTAYYGFSGGFLFLGIFLGLVFTFAAALIIYYKQISEGYYDKDKFEIMQKVGMSKAEVKKSIKTQVLMVFFAPLVMAGIHVLAAFNMIRRLLELFTLYNVKLFATCSIVTFVVFALIYAFVYSITAREYYKIVEE